MIDLAKNTGLPISLSDDSSLLFSTPLSPVTPSHRTQSDMMPYLMDEGAKFSGGKAELSQSHAERGGDIIYDMYRGVCLPQDCANFKNAGLRFDITVFHPGMLGEEFCKTAGHYHPFKPGTKVRYPETYEVISGKALFLMQKMDDNFNEVLDVCAIEVNEGEDVIFLPGYAHFAINVTDKILVTSNWVVADTEWEYEPVARFHGAAYYVIKGAEGKPEFIKNSNYKNIPELKFLKPKELPRFGLINNQPAYQTGQKSLDMLQYLNNPELYLEELTIEKCYFQIPPQPSLQ